MHFAIVTPSTQQTAQRVIGMDSKQEQYFDQALESTEILGEAIHSQATAGLSLEEMHEFEIKAAGLLFPLATDSMPEISDILYRDYGKLMAEKHIAYLRSYEDFLAKLDEDAA